MDIIVPGFIAVVAIVGLLKKVPIFDAFTVGAKNGLITLYKIIPTLIGLIVAVNMLKSSGALDGIIATCIRLRLNSTIKPDLY